MGNPVTCRNIQAAPVVFESSVFALKGGTAINLFVRDMPRPVEVWSTGRGSMAESANFLEGNSEGNLTSSHSETRESLESSERAQFPISKSNSPT